MLMDEWPSCVERYLIFCPAWILIEAFESRSKWKETCLSPARLRAGLKWLFIAVLWTVSSPSVFDSNPVMIAFYNRLKEKGKNGKVIVCAIMRKLVHVIFGVLKSGKKYDPNYKPAFAWQERYLLRNSIWPLLELRITGWKIVCSISTQTVDDL